jgi:hypothetical protein
VSVKTALERGFRRFSDSSSSAVFRVACLHFVCTFRLGAARRVPTGSLSRSSGRRREVGGRRDDRSSSKAVMPSSGRQTSASPESRSATRVGTACCSSSQAEAWRSLPLLARCETDVVYGAQTCLRVGAGIASAASRTKAATRPPWGCGRRAPVSRVLLLRAYRSLGRCVTSTACSGPPVRPAEHAGRGSAPRSSRLQETFLTTAVSWRELKGRSPGLSVDFSHVAHRRRWSGPEAAGLLPNAAAKVGVGASSVSRALAK